MKRIISSIVTLILLTILLAACYYDNEETLYPPLSSTCDTSNVTFSGTIAPIFADNCLFCHSNAKAAALGNNILLENYADVKANVILIDAAIKHSGTISPMPKNGGKIKDCYISQFDIWTRLGALNN